MNCFDRVRQSLILSSNRFFVNGAVLMRGSSTLLTAEVNGSSFTDIMIQNPHEF